MNSRKTPTAAPPEPAKQNKQPTLAALAILAITILIIPAAALAENLTAGQYSAALTENNFVQISAAGKPLFTLTGAESLSFKPDVSMNFGFFKFKQKNLATEKLRFAEITAGIGIAYGDSDVGSISIEQTPAGNLRVTAKIFGEHPAPGSLKLKFACSPQDKFWGFGEQYNYIDLRGKTLPVWQSEQGVGRAKKPAFPPIGSFTDSYFPMPYFIDPAAGKGLLIENTEYSQFDLCDTASDTWSVEVWNPEKISFLIFPGPAPADVITQLTSEVGRPKTAPPDWVFSGVWLASQRGPGVINDRVNTALKAGIPVSAVWAQDWLGERHFGTGNYGVKYRWLWDAELYPGLSKLIKSLREKEIRFLGYFNPFIVPDYEHYKEAELKGYLVKNKNGTPYIFQIVTFKGGLLDVTNPAAVEWFKDFARDAAKMGMSGWMCDFGEWLPFDAVTYAGSGAQTHNLYATAWHRINREVLEETYPGGDFALLTRSGYTGEQRVAQIVWAGDQEQQWDDTDGLPTVVTAALSAGLSGVPFFTTDIAGFSGGPSSKELFMRWTELGALMPVMRTHDGLKKFENHKFDTDPETLSHFTRMAKIHAALLPYFKQLAAKAVSTGLPVIRHTVLVDPGWDKSYSSNRQWMIGPDILFAPVVEKGAVGAEAFLPQGEWETVFTGEKFTGRQTVTIKAPLGFPAVFVRSGKLPEIVAQIRNIRVKIFAPGYMREQP